MAHEVLMRGRTGHRFWLWLGAVALLTGCLTKGEGEKLWAEVRALQAQNSEITASLTRNKTKLVDLMRSADQKVADLNKKIEQAESILRRSNVGFFTQIKQIQAQVSTNSGKIEQAERGLEVGKRDLDAFRSETTTKLTQLLAKPKTVEESLPVDPNGAFSMANGELTAGNYQRAVDFFLAILKRFPKHPRMADVQFALAQGYLGKKDYKQALAEFSRFYQDFGSSPRAAEALFRVARCYEALGDYRTAVLSLKVITKKFKDSDFAKEAKSLMKKLKRKL